MKRVSRVKESGSVMIEGAIVLPVLLLIIFAGMQLMIIAWHSVTTQFVVSRAVQRAAVGMCRGPMPLPGAYRNPSEDSICPAGGSPSVYAYEYAVGLARILGVNLQDYNATSNKSGLINPTVCVAKFDGSFANGRCLANSKKFSVVAEGEILGMIIASDSGFGSLFPKWFRLPHRVNGFALSIVS